MTPKLLVTDSVETGSRSLFTQRPQPFIHTRRRNDAIARWRWRMPLTVATMALMTPETRIKPSANAPRRPLPPPRLTGVGINSR